jgi:DNA polymerase III gamma/tau subunit
VSLYQKYRPKDFSEMVGNKSVLESLGKLSVLLMSKQPHALLFYGPSGCGKTTAARIWASKLAAHVRELNMSETRGIDAVRSIIDECSYTSLMEAVVWILDEAHGLTNEAENALLKLLEDPPQRVTFILCTTEPQKINNAIANRCNSFGFKPVTSKQVYSLLSSIRDAEQFSVSDDVLLSIVDAVDGIPRKAIVLLESVSLVNEEKNQLDIIKKEAQVVDETRTEILELLKAVTFGRKWEETGAILSHLEKQKEDPEKLRRTILVYMNRVFLGSAHDRQATTDLYQRMIPFFSQDVFYSGFPALVYQCYKSFLSRGLPF